MNFRRILSKSSLKSSSSAAEKSLCPSEEVAKLQSEVELLKQTIESFKVSVESRDAAIGTLAREKEKLYVELKSAQRTNRNLHQQLADERDIHQKEKNYLVEEIKRLSENNSQRCNAYSIERNILDAQSESSLKDELKSKDEVIYNVCTKYLKIRSSKERLMKKQHKLRQRIQQICEGVITLLDEHRRSLDCILRKMCKAAAMPPSTKSYLNLLKVNANLHYENTQLKVCLYVNEFSTDNQHEKESSRKEFNLPEVKSQNFIGKSKIYQHHHHNNSQLSKSINNDSIKEIRYNQTKFAPYFRRKRPYNSEPNLVTFSKTDCKIINY